MPFMRQVLYFSFEMRTQVLHVILLNVGFRLTDVNLEMFGEERGDSASEDKRTHKDALTAKQ